MVPFVYQDYLIMYTFELVFVHLAWGTYLISILTYNHQWLNPWPSVFGYHDSCHAISIVGAVTVAVFNASICARIF